MVNFPFFRFPYYNYYPYYNYTKKNTLSSCPNNDSFEETEKNIELKNKNKSSKKIYSKYNLFNLINFINPFGDSINNEKPILEILGLELYFDDLLLIGLLILLYNENVQDETLFYILILLLFT